MLFCFFFLMIRRPPRSTRTDTLFPYTTLFRSETSRHADYILPAMTFYEREDLTDLWVTNAVRPWVQYTPPVIGPRGEARRSEEHTSELQSLMRISYAVFCLKKKTTSTNTKANRQPHDSIANT